MDEYSNELDELLTILEYLDDLLDGFNEAPHE